MTNKTNNLICLLRDLRAKGYTYTHVGYLVGGMSRQSVQQMLARWEGKPLKIKVDYTPSITTKMYSVGTEDWLINYFKPSTGMKRRGLTNSKA